MSSSTLNLGPYRYTPRKFLDETRMSKLWIALERAGEQRDGDDPAVTLKIARMTEEKFSYANQRAIENEERWLSRLQHPNIVKLRPIAEEGGSYRPIYRARSTLPGKPWFLVIDYLPGGDLKHLMDDRSCLSASLSLHIAQHLGQAVDFVHQHGCIHCDLKSRNILFREKPANYVLSAESEPILIDFGVAKDARDGPQRVTGTPAWMPPEAEASLRAGDKLSPQSDWDTYALGLILYNMVTGKPPRLGLFSSESWERVEPEQFARDPSVADPVALASGLNHLIEQAVSDRPGERLTAKDFTAQVRDLRVHTQIPAEPKPHRQGRRGLVGIGILVAMIVLLLSLGPRIGIFGPADPPAAPGETTNGGTAMPLIIPVTDEESTATATPVSTDEPAATLAPTREPTATDVPTATAIATSTPTRKLTNTPTLTPTKTKPKPTSTPLPATKTPRPTRTPRPTATAKPGTATARPVVVPSNTQAYAALIAPIDGLSARHLVQFSWGLDFTPRTNDCFEVRLWEGSPDNWANGFGIRGHSKETSFQQRFDEELEFQYSNHQLRPGTAYYWGVLLVDCDPYKTQRLISDVRNFTYEAP